MTLVEMLDAKQKKAEQGAWTPACGGTEVPFLTRSGRRLLYVYQATTGKHAYLDCGTDLILSDEEVRLALGTWQVCASCNETPVHKVGSKDGAEKKRAHLAGGCPKLLLHIKALPQQKR